MEGAGGGRLFSLQGFDRLPTQRVPPLYYFEISIFSDGPINFLKAPFAPIYTNFEGGGAPAEKTRFFGQNLKKLPKNAFFARFF